MKISELLDTPELNESKLKAVLNKIKDQTPPAQDFDAPVAAQTPKSAPKLGSR